MNITAEENKMKLEELIGSAKIIDLSRPFEPGMPAMQAHSKYGSVICDSYDWGGGAYHCQVTFSEHNGTHVDAPNHFIRGGSSIDKIPFESLIGRLVKIDATGAQPRSLLPAKAIADFEEKHGLVKKGDIVMFRFGWDMLYANQPGSSRYLSNWPGLSKEAAELLVKREIKAAGCDTLSLDACESKGSPVHHTLLGQGILIIENVCNLDKVPVHSFIIGMPLKFKDGSGSPVRLAAIIQD